MLEIMEKQKLELKNLFCFRGKVKQTEVDGIVKDMEDKLCMAKDVEEKLNFDMFLRLQRRYFCEDRAMI